jgi:hypothetical protein
MDTQNQAQEDAIRWNLAHQAYRAYGRGFLDDEGLCEVIERLSKYQDKPVQVAIDLLSQVFDNI